MEVAGLVAPSWWEQEGLVESTAGKQGTGDQVVCVLSSRHEQPLKGLLSGGAVMSGTTV